MAAVLGGHPGHHDHVPGARGDLVVAPGAPVGLHRLERVDEADFERVGAVSNVRPLRSLQVIWWLRWRPHASAEQGPEEEQHAHRDGSHHDPDVGASAALLTGGVESHGFSVPQVGP